MRTVATILMLCLPVASFADVWFCTSEAMTRNMPSVGSSASNSQRSFIADTEKGLRWIDSETYVGECIVTRPFNSVDCKANGGNGLGFRGEQNPIEYRLFILEGTGMFTASEHALERVRILTYAGRCTKA